MRTLEQGSSSGSAWTEDRFAAFAAHELRTPIALQRLLAEAALADPGADMQALCEEIITACDRQQRLLDALLELTRSGRSVPGRQPVDLATLTREVLGAHDVHALEVVAALGPAHTSGDATLLQRLCANLVGNAIRHNVPGGRVEVATATHAGFASLSITNTGPIISPGRLTRLFEPFERGPHPSEWTDGFGLGLSIVESIAHAHDANITAHPRAGGGLVITVDFPGG
jgi:signal transduction histidine kinase